MPGQRSRTDFAWLEEQLGVRLPIEPTRPAPADYNIEELLRLGSKEQLAPIARLAARRHAANAVMWACSSGSFVQGTAGVRRQARCIGEAAGAPSSSTSIAFLEALRTLRINKVAVASTYPPAVTGHFVHLLCDEGFKVASCASHRLPPDAHTEGVDPEDIRDLVGDRFCRDVEAVLVPDTALPAAPLVDELERSLDKIVLTAAQVTAWYGLRLAGWYGRAPGLGRLFL